MNGTRITRIKLIIRFNKKN